MGPQLLLIPALFVAICATFIILHSCYHRWTSSTTLLKKKEAAKISLVNILQMTNATLPSPPWSASGAVKSKIKPQVLVNDSATSPSSETEDNKEKSQSISLSYPTFDPRNPNVLSTFLTLSDQQHSHYCPPPCYEDLYGPGGAVFTFKSLTSEREEQPPPQFSSSTKAPGGGTQYQYYSNNGNNTSCLLQVPHPEVPIPCQERRNSSAVLYL